MKKSKIVYFQNKSNFKKLKTFLIAPNLLLRKYFNINNQQHILCFYNFSTTTWN